MGASAPLFVSMYRIFLFVGVLALIALDPPLFIGVFSFLYAISGPVQHLRRNEVQAGDKEDDAHDSEVS